MAREGEAPAEPMRRPLGRSLALPFPIPVSHLKYVMQPIHGYHGRYLRVDLSTGLSTEVLLEEKLLREFLGGSGLGVALMLKEGAATMDPLAPEAVLAFVFSPLVGSPLTTSAKFAVVSKSPLTQRLNDSLASSGFALAGKKTFCDANSLCT